MVREVGEVKLGPGRGDVGESRVGKVREAGCGKEEGIFGARESRGGVTHPTRQRSPHLISTISCLTVGDEDSGKMSIITQGNRRLIDWKGWIN